MSRLTMPLATRLLTRGMTSADVSATAPLMLMGLDQGGSRPRTSAIPSNRRFLVSRRRERERSEACRQKRWSPKGCGTPNCRYGAGRRGSQ